jgi:hypothetical protein
LGSQIRINQSEKPYSDLHQGWTRIKVVSWIRIRTNVMRFRKIPASGAAWREMFSQYP